MKEAEMKLISFSFYDLDWNVMNTLFCCNMIPDLGSVLIYQTIELYFTHW